MPGHRNFKELRGELADKVGENRLAAAENAELERYEAEQLRLVDVRRARSLTQTQLAKVLGVSQAQVSRIETQSDLFLSTLASYVEAMGGELQLVAAFGNERVHLEIGGARGGTEDVADEGDTAAGGRTRTITMGISRMPKRPATPSPHRDHQAELRSSGLIEKGERLVGLDLSWLSNRQRAVLDQVAVGASMRDIATQLGISEETARRHMRAALDKLKLPRDARIIREPRPRGAIWGVFRETAPDVSDLSLN